eukprot:SAG31_NODE_5505_length_2496_cov_2.588652_4_plen_51_part_01
MVKASDEAKERLHAIRRKTIRIQQRYATSLALRGMTHPVLGGRHSTAITGI